MIERQIEIATKDGRMNTFICHPERAGPHPVVIFYMDAPGIREELRDMARRLGTAGYYVMLPNLYYRSNVEDLNIYAGGPEARARAMALMVTIDIPKVMSDTDALIAFADTDPAARCNQWCPGNDWRQSSPNGNLNALRFFRMRRTLRP